MTIQWMFWGVRRDLITHRTVDGIVFPTKRRVYAYEGDYQVVKEPLLVSIDMGEITLSF